MTDLYARDVRALRHGYRHADFSPVQVMQSVLAHVQRREPSLCATLLRSTQALHQLGQTVAVMTDLEAFEHIAAGIDEQPAASTNCGFTSTGLPIGRQIAGQRFDGLGVLQVARAFELLRAPQRPWPEPPPSDPRGNTRT